MDAKHRIRIAHSPDPDDAFMFHALTTEAFDTGNYTYNHTLDDIETLNQRALDGEYEVSAVSIHALPDVLDKYVLMNCGGSMGEGYGPRIVAREPMAFKDLKKCKIAVPGKKTSAHLALIIALGQVDVVFIPFDKIMDAVLNEEVDAGLVIHEGQLTWSDYGLHLIADLGEWWHDLWGLPLPLGGNIVRRDLGKDVYEQVTEDVKKSISYALANPKPALTFAKQWGRGIDDDTNREFVDMYVNQRTIDYGIDGRRAIRLLLKEGQRIGMIRNDLDVEGLEFIGIPSETKIPARSKFDSIDPAPPSTIDDLQELGRTVSCEESRMFERMKALFELRNIGGQEAITKMASGFESSSVLMKHEVAYVMGQMQDRAAIPFLLDRLEDNLEDDIVRHEAAEALGAIGDRRIKPILIKYSKDKSRVVAESCEVALDLLKWLESDALEYSDSR